MRIAKENNRYVILTDTKLEFEIIRESINLLYNEMVCRYGTKFDTDIEENLLEKIMEVEKILELINGEK